jgi:hypothetical protein
MLALSLPLHRVGAVLALSVVAAGAQAVVFDATNTTNHEPLLVTATSALGSLTVNANGWDTTATSNGVPKGTQLTWGNIYPSKPVSASVDVANGGVSFTPAVSYELAASYTTPSVSTMPNLYMVAGVDIPVLTSWADPAATGLTVSVSGLASYLGQASPNGVGNYGVKYNLTLNAISKTGQSLSLLSVQSPQQVQQSFAYTALVPAGFDLASLSGSLTAAFSSSGGAPDPFGYKGLGTSYRVSIDHITLIPTAAAVPEPATLALMGLGLAGVAAAARRRRQA